MEYAAEAGVCGKCNWREHCTTAVAGRTVQRHEQAAQVAAGKAIAHSPQGQRDRWRRLWCQEIQDWLIAAVQNVKLLVKAGGKNQGGAAAATELGGEVKELWRRITLPGPVWPG